MPSFVPYKLQNHDIVDPRQAVTERDLSRRTAAEYKTEILSHMEDMDLATRPNAAMINTQPEIDWEIWPFLIDFMIDSHARLELEPQTLFMAVNIVNRYCARRIVYRKHLQLVGCTALWIASKYEDKKGKVPTLATLSNMCCSVYQPIMFVQMEGHVLNTLDWVISHCTVDSFLSICLSHGASPLLTSLTSYLAELALYIRPFIGMSPQTIARAIHVLALHILSFYPNLPSQSMSDDEFECLQMLSKAIVMPSRTVVEKYATSDRYEVSRLVSSYVKRNERLSESPCERVSTPVHPQPLTNVPTPVQTPVQQYNSSGTKDLNLPPTPPQSATHRHAPQTTSSATTCCSTATPPHFSLNHTYGAGSTSSLSSGTPQMQCDDSPLTIQSQIGDYASMTGVIDELVQNDVVVGAGARGSPPPTPLVAPKMPFARSRVM